MGWAEDLRQKSLDLVKKVSQFKRKVAVEALSEIVYRTPVDTGRARGNWQTTIGQPATGTLEVLDKSGSTTIQRGAVVIGQSDLTDPIYISNNLPYIENLEYGSSQQAPAGMVRVTATRFEEFLRRNRDALE